VSAVPPLEDDSQISVVGVFIPFVELLWKGLSLRSGLERKVRVRSSELILDRRPE